MPHSLLAKELTILFHVLHVWAPWSARGPPALCPSSTYSTSHVWLSLDPQISCYLSQKLFPDFPTLLPWNLVFMSHNFTNKVNHKLPDNPRRHVGPLMKFVLAIWKEELSINNLIRCFGDKTESSRILFSSNGQMARLVPDFLKSIWNKLERRKKFDSIL